MLDIALNHSEELKQKFRSIWFKEKYKYWANANYYTEWEAQQNTWEEHQITSIKDGKVIGYIAYGIDRSSDVVRGLNIINFQNETSMTFSMDLGIALRNIFEKYKFRKLCFSVIIGNPIEKAYDKLCQKYGGRIVGIQKSNVKLIDGDFYDEKLYEIFLEDYKKIRSK